VKKGEKHLLKGPSGCGKTTAVNLLLRYYDPCAGTIELDGVPIEAFSGTYGLMTVVRQEATLFRDTLRNNLTLYRPIAEERLIAVLNSVGLSRLADALDEPVDEGGANFSGGEKKRICLARALLRDRAVLLLDEPLANLDPETAQRIEDLLLSIRARTMIVVSHQFTESKLARFDRITDLH
jgi:ABC-type multidrug transport system fused ATPase/permease subunit